GKTVIKSTYGKYFLRLDGSSGILTGNLAANYNKNTVVATTYRWHDLNRDGQYQPGEVNLDTNGPDFISTTSAANARVNPDLKLSRVQELSASLERELAPNLAVRALFV